MIVRNALAAFLGIAILSAPLTAVAAEPPDFSKPGQVRDSLNAMLGDLRPQAKQHGWQELRAIGMCEDALDRLQDRRSSAAYAPEAGRQIWNSCRRAYGRARMHANPRAPDHVGKEEGSY